MVPIIKRRPRTGHMIQPHNAQLELDVSVITVTDWIEGKNPEYVGWYEVESNNAVNEIRRWWDGSHWSWPVSVGDDDDYAMSMQHRVSVHVPLRWRGLSARHPKDYDWSLKPLGTQHE